MARSKAEYKAPETMENLEGKDGIEIATVTRYFERAKRNKDTKEIVSGKDRPVTFKVVIVAEGKTSGAGLKAIQGAINSKHDGQGNNVLARAYNNEQIENVFSALKAADDAEKDLPDSLTIYPDFGKVRVTDEIEAAGDLVKAKIAAGEVTPDQLAAFFASLSKK